MAAGLPVEDRHSVRHEHTLHSCVALADQEVVTRGDIIKLRIENPAASGAIAPDDDLAGFKQLFELSPDPTWVIDGNRFVECNEAAIRTLGYSSRAELLNVHPSKLSPTTQPDGEDSFVKAERMMAIAKDSGLHRFEWVHTKANGTDFVAEVTLSAIQLADRQVIYCVWRDITERKQAETALRESEARYSTLIQNIAEGIGFVDTGEQFVLANPAAEGIFGVPPGGLVGRSLREFTTPEEYSLIEEQTRRRQAGETSAYEHEICRTNGQMRRLLVTAVPQFDDRGQFTGAFAVFRDITERKQAEAALRGSEIELQCILESTSDGLLAINHDGKVIRVNRRFGQLWQIPQSLLDSKDDQALLAHVVGQLAEPQEFLNKVQALYGSDLEVTDTISFKDGRVFESFTSPLKMDALAIGRIWSFRDITERKQMEQQVLELAFYDPLTQLPNRRLLGDRLSQALADSKRSNRYGALTFLDLDNFKALNDNHGHAVGDLLLVQAATRMKSCVREVDTVARHGGDEFVVVMCDLNENRAESSSQAISIVEKIRSALAEPFTLTVKHEGKADATMEYLCTASIGVVVFIDGEGSQEDFFRWADSAMYRAKDAGGNLIRCYELDN